MNQISKLVIKVKNEKRRKKLHNINFTIISSNCVGG
ncbi:DUF1919 domain-containing protein [Lactobacillus delbrueckii subsp. bulgaricus]